jgi:hypothetical protein
MRKLLLGAALGALLAPAAAHAETTGFADIAYEYGESGGNSLDSWNIGAGIQHDFDNNWSIQGDARTNTFHPGFSVASGYTALHLYTELNPSVDLGAFVGMIDFNGDGTTVGLESRVHQGQWSLQGSLGYTKFDITLGNSEAWDARVLGAWFVNSDTALEPSISYSEWHEGNWTHTQFSLGLGAAHRFSNGLEAYAGYVHSDNDSTPVGPYQVDTLRVGLRLNLGAGDLQSITNDGASWYGAAGMYEAFTRW